MITFVATAHNERQCQCPIIDSLLAQSCPDWKLIVYHNGPNPEMHQWITGCGDSRITYTESPVDNGNWGTYNRKDALERLVSTPYITNTSIQDYYLPNAVAEIIKATNAGTEFIHWQAINHLFNYNVLSGEIAFGHLDWGQVCVKTELLKKAGIQKLTEFCSDWFTFQAVLRLCKKIHKVDKILTIHN